MKVLDLSNVIAGPAATRTLAEYGADVIKIDGPDPTIGPRMSILFGIDVGQGKRSIIVDIKAPKGREIFVDLVRRADVVLHNNLDDAAQRLGISHSQLRGIKPDIITVQVSAYGGTGPGGWEEFAAFDPVLQDVSGIQTRFGSDGSPQLHAIASCIDYLTGYSATFGALVALFQRNRLQVGSDVRTSLARAACYIQFPFTVSSQESAGLSEPSGQRATGLTATHRIFETSNNWLFVATHPGHLDADKDLYKTVGVRNSTQLTKLFKTRPSEYWLNILQRANIAAHPVFSLDEIRKQYTQSIEIDTSFEMASGPYRVLRHQHPCGLEVSLMAPTWVRSEKNPIRRLSPAPAYGSHSREIIQQLDTVSVPFENLVQERIVLEQWTELTTYLPT